MTSLTRRQFLTLSGAALSGLALPRLPNFPAAPAPTHGFALSATPVYAQPDSAAPLLRHLWPESISAIDEAASLPNWYRVADGYVQRTALQAITLYPPQPYRAALNLPALAQVCGASATLHSECAADSPIVRRWLHGTTAHISDQLPAEPHGWYHLSDSTGQPLGWSQAAVWNILSNS